MLTTFKKLRQILNRREKLQLGALLVAISAMAFSQAIGVASVMPFISLVMEPEMISENRWLYWAYYTFGFDGMRSFIIFAGLVMFGIILFSNVVSALATWLKLKFAWMNNHRLSRRLLEKYLSMPYAYFLNQNSSDLSKNILTEINTLTVNYLIPLLTIITKGTVAVFILLMLFWIDIWISLVAIVFLGGAYGAIFWRVNRNLKQRGSKRLQANKMRFKAVSEAFGGIKEIKVLNREPHFLKVYSKESLKHALYMSWNAVVGQLPRFALEAIAFGGIIIFVLILLITREDARQVIPLTGLFAFAGYRLMPALQEVFHSFTKMQFNLAVLDRVYQDITAGANPTARPLPDKKELPEPLPVKKEIRLQNVTYNYPETSVPVISNINMIIEYNTSVAFVGPTGAGKTTLADIILGLLVPQEGLLLVDGVPVDETNLKNWQLNIGYVPQYIYLSDDTVTSNIAFGVSEKVIDHRAIERAACIANIDKFITEELPQGYDTLVGERGIRLSGGQRQRIGIARALYHDPAVLVFDEATSALDGATEDAVLGAMANAARMKTLIIIAHRLPTVKNCDQVYLLDRGKIVAQGKYEELLESNLQFKEMAKVKI